MTEQLNEIVEDLEMQSKFEHAEKKGRAGSFARWLRVHGSSLCMAMFPGIVHVNHTKDRSTLKQLDALGHACRCCGALHV